MGGTAGTNKMASASFFHSSSQQQKKTYLSFKAVHHLLHEWSLLNRIHQLINIPTMKKILFLLVLAAIIFSCNDAANDSMSDQAASNKAKAQRFYDEVINGHNPALIDTFCTKDFTDHNPSQGHSGKGSDDLRAAFTEMFAAFPDVKLTPDFIIAKGDTVVAYVTMTGTNSGAMGPMPATNKSFKINGIDIILVKDGKATDRWGVFDDMSLMTQLGTIPSANSSTGNNK
jgi:steroid delta-isomerase-like uncharacterized protein